MRQWRYAWEDIIQNKAQQLVLFVQIAVALVLFSFVVSTATDVAGYRARLESIVTGKEIHFTRDMTDPEVLERQVFSAPDGSERMAQLYSFIKEESGVMSYTAEAQHMLWINDLRLDPALAVRSDPEHLGFNLLAVDENFVQLFQLTCVEGRLLSGPDFHDPGSVIPVLLGHDFHRTMQLGDVLTDYLDVQYEVVGFLAPSSFYLDPSKGDDVYTLDNWFVVPILPHRIGNYDAAINSTFFITNNPDNLLAVQARSSELNLYTFEFRSFSDQMQRIQEHSNLQIKIIGLMLTVLLTFSVIGLISNLLQFITTHMKEFAVHLLCGGRVTSLIQRILIQVFILITAADVIVLTIHKISLTTLITVLFSLVTGLVIVIYPALTLTTAGVSNLIRRSD